MTRTLAALALAVGLWCTLVASPARAVDLLHDADGADSLDRWESFSDAADAPVADVWQLRDGVLTCRGLPKGYLYTRQDYGDFILRLQWRWPPKGTPGKGGVLLRTTGPNKIWPKSLEAQINTGQEGDFWGLDGFHLEGPTERLEQIDHPQFGQLTHLKRTVPAEKPAGQWNDYEIEARGDTVTLRLNGKVVNRATGCETLPGRILLTAEGNPIQFRRVELEELKQPSQ